jgi:hypothetical protein
MPLNLDLSGSVAKVARANEHLETLRVELEEINRKRNPYALRLQGNSEGGYSLILCGNEFLEPRLGIILGDAVHNLRSALDYIIVALIAKSGAPLTTQHEFPIFADQGDYIAKAPRKLDGITFGRDEIASVQPFNQETPRHDPLFVVHHFSNADKHRVISEYVPIIYSLDDARLRPAPSTVKRSKPPNYLRPNEESEIARFTYDYRPVTIDLQAKITVSVHFGTPAFGKLAKGLGASPGIFQRASVRIASIVEMFSAL